MPEPEDLPGEVIDAIWNDVGPDIDDALERVRSARAFQSAPGSVLAGDDAVFRPLSYSVTAAVRSCLASGLDHLHALKSHVVDGPVLSISAPFSLARGALENLSIGYWIVHPDERSTRVERALRWWAQNCLDADRALQAPGALGTIEDGKKESTLRGLEDVARRTAGVAVAEIRRGHSSTVAVKYTDQHAAGALQILFAWRLCSGFAHGRGWAIHGFSSAETVHVAELDKHVVRLSANDTAIVWVTLSALSLASEIFRILDRRAGEASEQSSAAER
ncbi:hypothetical protein [Nocardia terpenica]|uniref:Uncharacterized protein n=1 Tax=Nocardia terpenica TaxID=455432 RepID=A0A164HIT2_9NOCA|nr:hypothetical protein [Nocardia terpenica]KZM68553.1 hypothetical protein AWN90_11880 [Nocardia terpenica]NQE88484.1 hypothetical protein [Nocardia terpenica]